MSVDIKSTTTSDVTSVCLSEDSHPSFIEGYMLSDTSVCDGLIQFVDSPQAIITGETFKGGVVGADGKRLVDSSIKDCTQRVITGDDPTNIAYGNELQKCLLAYIKKFKYAGMVARFNASTCEAQHRPLVQKYQKGGAYHAWHTERTNKVTSHRHLVFMTYLNDVTDAGETEFLYQKLKVKPRKGLTLIWPTDWTHTHRGLPSPTQEKYIVTGWYSFTGE